MKKDNLFCLKDSANSSKYYISAKDLILFESYLLRSEIPYFKETSFENFGESYCIFFVENSFNSLIDRFCTIEKIKVM